MLDEALEEKPSGDRVRIGMVVIRGNAVVMLEVCVASVFQTTSKSANFGHQALDRINTDDHHKGGR